MQTALVVVLSLAVLGLLESGYNALRFLSERRGRELRRRLQAGGIAVPLDSALLRQGRFSSIPALDRWLAARGWARRIEHLLEQADSRMTVAQLCLFTLIGATPGLLVVPWVGAAASLV